MPISIFLIVILSLYKKLKLASLVTYSITFGIFSDYLKYFLVIKLYH